MKTLFATVAVALLTVTSVAQAQPYQRPGSPSIHGHHHHHYYHPQPRHYHQPHRHRDWVGPAIVTGIGTAIIVDQIHRRNYPGPVIVEEVITPAPFVPVVPVPSCSGWREIQLSDGTVYRERICSQ